MVAPASNPRMFSSQKSFPLICEIFSPVKVSHYTVVLLLRDCCIYIHVSHTQTHTHTHTHTHTQKPWYKNFTGTIAHVEPHKYMVYGNVARLSPTSVEITELPIRSWTQVYKENVLEPMLHGTEKVQPFITYVLSPLPMICSHSTRVLQLNFKFTCTYDECMSVCCL